MVRAERKEERGGTGGPKGGNISKEFSHLAQGGGQISKEFTHSAREGGRRGEERLFVSFGCLNAQPERLQSVDPKTTAAWP